MTRIDELKSQIADKKKRMSEINNAVETAKRVKTAEERTEFDNLNKEVTSLQAELNDVEAVQRIKEDAPAIISSEQKDKNKRYNIVKAISEFSQGRLSGLEAEMHQEASRTFQGSTGLLIPDNMIYRTNRTETFANSTGLYTQEAIGLDIVAPQSIADQLGVTVYNNLTVTQKMNYAQGVNSDSVAEGAALSAKTYTKTTDEIAPVFYGHQIPVSKQALAVTSMVQDFILDADSAIKAKLFKNLLNGILATGGCILPGYSATTTASGMTSKIVTKLTAAVLSPIFRKPAFVSGAVLYAELGETQAATTLRTIIQDGKISGYNAYNASTLLGLHDTNKYDIIFGDWSRAYFGLFGNAMEVIADNYTNATTGVVNLTFNRLMDYSFNPYTFKAIRNAKLAS